MKRKVSIIVLILSLLLISIVIMSSNMKNIRDYSNDQYSLKYDGTWKIKGKNNYDLEFEHKKTKSSLIIKYKKLDDSYIDTKLDLIITDIMKSIEIQNEGFLVISEDRDDNGNYSYLYESDKEQVLITVMKKDANLFIVYYNALFENFDIVLDSVEEVIDSMILK